MPATAEPKNDLARFRPLPPDKFDCVENRPVFAEHEAIEHYSDPTTGEEKTRVVRYDKNTLEAICDNVNKRVYDTGDYVALTAGHTPTKEQKEKGMSDPDVLGYAGPFHLEQIGDRDPRWAIVADRFCTFKGDAERVKRLGRCSVEMYETPDATKRFFDPVALLGSDMPRLGLGITYSAQGHEGYPVQRYGMPACAGMNNTFVPGPTDVDAKPPKKARYEDGAEYQSDIDPDKAKKEVVADAAKTDKVDVDALDDKECYGMPEGGIHSTLSSHGYKPKYEGTGLYSHPEGHKVSTSGDKWTHHHSSGTRKSGTGAPKLNTHLSATHSPKAAYEMPSDDTDISPEKAKQMLKDGTAHGHELTEKQEGFLGAVAGKERHAMPEGDEPKAEPEDGDMAMSEEDLSKLVDAFMQTEEMQFVHTLMQEHQAKGDAANLAQTAEGGEPIPVDQHAIPKSSPPPEFPGTVKQDLGEEILNTGNKLEGSDIKHGEVKLPAAGAAIEKKADEKPEIKKQEKEMYAMDAAVEVAKVREELAQEKARYAQAEAAKEARIAALEASHAAERAKLVTRARYSKLQEIAQTRAPVDFEKEWDVCKDLDDAGFDRHLATIQRYTTELGGKRGFIPVAEPEERDFGPKQPEGVSDRVAEANMQRDPRFHALVKRHANSGKKVTSAELRNEYKKLNGQPVAV